MKHPGSLDGLPEAARKVLSGPAPLRMMLARGMAPLPPPAMVCGLYSLAFDPDEKLAAAATATFEKLGGPVLEAALGSADLPPEVLDLLAQKLKANAAVLEKIVQHPRVDAETISDIARTSPEMLSELIATNEQRLLAHPQIIESLYYNRNTRMSTADRIVDLAARNHVTLKINGFEDIVAELKNQLLPEPGESLPSDDMFREALEEGEHADAVLKEDEDIVETTEDGNEIVKEPFKKVSKKLSDMTNTELMRAAQIGPVTHRLMLVRSPNRAIAKLAIESPLNQPIHAARIAASREVSSEILRVIHRRKDWLQIHQVKKALATNPKTPIDIATGLLNYLRDGELRSLSRNRNVNPNVKTAATQILSKRSERSGGGGS